MLEHVIAEAAAYLQADEAQADGARLVKLALQLDTVETKQKLEGSGSCSDALVGEGNARLGTAGARCWGGWHR